MFPLAKIPERDIPYIERSERGGGPVKGGYVCEEPTVPLELALDSRGSATAPRQGLPMPPRIKRMLEQQGLPTDQNEHKRSRSDDSNGLHHDHAVDPIPHGDIF
jgi:hypothetical protein